MSYKQLLDHVAQVKTRPITLMRDIVPMVEKITGHRHEFVEVDLNVAVSRGHVRPVADASAPKGFVNQVRFAADQSFCWKRFVCVKEVMHAFDGPAARTNTEDRFNQLISDWAMLPPPESWTDEIKSEYRTEWMALVALCPKRFRDRYRADFETKAIKAYDVAFAIRIPEVYIRSVMGPAFNRIEEALQSF